MGRKKEAKQEILLHKIIMVGTGGVGKSALTLQFMYGDFTEDYDPTKADSYRKLTSFDGKDANVDILDTAGQEEYAAIRDNYYRSGEGFICVFSVVDKESFGRTRDFRDQICRVLDNEKVPFVLIGNKCDLQAKRQVTRMDAETLANEWGCSYIETSAKTKANVNEAYLKILRLIHDKKAADGSNTTKSKKKSRKCTIL